jgi:tetratricopeptide (TPR) repeat protein
VRPVAGARPWLLRTVWTRRVQFSVHEIRAWAEFDQRNECADMELKKAQWQRIAQASDDRPAQTVWLATAFLRAYPTDGSAWLLLGTALGELARYREARQAFRRAMRHAKPGRQWLVHVQVGSMWKHAGKLAQAVRAFEQAIRCEPQSTVGYILAGGCLARMGKLAAAEALHRRAVQCKEGALDEAWLNLGLVLRALQNHDEAAEALRKSLAIDPHYDEARTALADVEALLRANVHDDREGEALPKPRPRRKPSRRRS